MSSNVYWLQCGGCGGDTWSLFNAESPNVVELFNALDINLLWHPSISIGDRFEQLKLNEAIIAQFFVVPAVPDALTRATASLKKTLWPRWQRGRNIYWRSELAQALAVSEPTRRQRPPVYNLQIGKRAVSWVRIL